MSSMNATDPPVVTYSDYYDAEENDPYGGNYGSVMADYDLDGAGAISPDHLADAVNTCAAQ